MCCLPIDVTFRFRSKISVWTSEPWYSRRAVRNFTRVYVNLCRLAKFLSGDPAAGALTTQVFFIHSHTRRVKITSETWQLLHLRLEHLGKRTVRNAWRPSWQPFRDFFGPKWLAAKPESSSIVEWQRVWFILKNRVWVFKHTTQREHRNKYNFFSVNPFHITETHSVFCQPQ